MKKFTLNLRKSLMIMAVTAIFCASATQAIGQDLDPVTPTPQVIPAGSFVIAMDDTLQYDANNKAFNIKAYGLLGTILDNRIELLWAIRAGKVKDDTDFSATATRAFPTAQAAAFRRFRTGPFIVPANDTVGLRAIINTFNAAAGKDTVFVYQLTSAATVDIRYTLTERPRVAVLNDGGNAMIQLNYMTLASMPTINYEELALGTNLTNPDTCFTFASEPHDDGGANTPSVLDSIRSFVTNFGGNFLAECAAIPTYENNTNGRYQTTLGIVDQNPSNNQTLINPHPDLSFSQYEGIFDGNAVGGSCHTYELVTGSVFTNSGSKYDQYGLGADSIIMCQSVSKNGTGVGHLVFYTGGHDYGQANDVNRVNGMRSYFNAMFTPSNVQTCAFLIFNNDLAVTKTAKPTSLVVSQQDTFTMIIKNNGPSSVAATGVTAVDTLPAGFSFVSAHSSTGTSYSSSTHVWTVGTLSLNQSDTLTIIATAISGGSITNTIFINKDQYDFNTANDTARATVVVGSCATVNAGRDTTICSGNSVILGGSPTASGGTGVYTYSWSPSTGLNSNTLANPLATPTVTTTYIVAVTSGNCTTNDTVVITVHPSPTITAGSSSPTYCAGSTIDLLSSPSGGTTPYASFHWAGPNSYSGTGQNPTIPNSTTAMTGIYDVTVTDADGCSASAATSNIAVNPNLSVSAGSGSSAYCSGTTLSLNSSASGGTSPFGYTWAGPNSFSNSNQNPSISNVIAIDSGLYSVTITDSKGCSGTGSVNVAVHQSPTVTASSSSPTYCSGATIILNSNPSGGLSPYNYSWSGPDAFSSNQQGPTRPNSVVAMSGTYDVTVTDNNGCSASAATGNVTVNQSPSITAGSSSTTYCSGAAIQLISNPLNGTSPFHYAWAGPASYDSTSQNPTVPNSTPSNSGIYSVTVTDANTCTASASTPNITVNPNLTVSLNSSFVICSGNCATLTTSTSGGTSPFGYSWSNGAAPVSNPTVCPTSTQSYAVTVTDSKGCSGTATTTVTVHLKPTADAGSNESIPACSLTGTTIGNSPTASGGTTPYTYLWSPSSGLSSDTVADPGVKGIGSNTTYTVVVTDSNGCSASSNVTVLVTGSTLNVTITANGPQNWCASSGGNVTLTAIGQNGFPPYTTFLWTGSHLSSDTTASVIVNPDTAGTYLYSVVITDTTGCQAGTSTSVTVYASPTAHAGAVSDTICNGTSVILGGGPTATGGTSPYTYAWSGGGGAAPVSNPTVTPGSTTTYTVVVTDSNSCSASSSSTIVVRTSPNANAGPGQTLPTCSPTGVSIGGGPTASGGGGGPYTYIWSPSVDLSSITIANPQVIGLTVDTTYTVTVADVYGCTASSAVTVDVVNNTPKINIAALGPVSWCANSGSSIGLSAVVTHGTNPFDYSWSGADLTSFNSQTTSANPNAAASYTYHVTVTDAFNCTATDSIKVTVNATPTAVADTGGVNYLICSGTSATIGGNPTASGGKPPYTYAWNNGASTVANPTVFPAASTVYVVTVTDSLGCSASATTTVFVRSPVVASAGTSQTISACSNSCTLLGGTPTASGGSGGGYTYHWSPSTGLNDSTIANPTACGLSGNTFYNVTVTDSTGCSASAQVLIRVGPSTLAANVEPGGAICPGSGSSVMLGGFPTAVGGTPPYTYTWSPTTGLNLADPANPEATPTVTTGYDLTLTDAQGCSATAAALVTVDQKIIVNAGTDTTVCAGFPVNLGGNPTASGGSGSYTYQWSPTSGLTNATVANPQALASVNSTYFVTVTDGSLCSATGSIILTVHSSPTANAGSDKTMAACPLDSVKLGAVVAATGGTPPYTYLWTPATGLDSTNVPNPVVKGIDSTTNYILFVTDNNGCVATSFVTVTVTPSTLQAEAGNGGSLCSNSTTPFELGGLPTAVGGQPPYTYHWSPTVGLSDSTAPNPTALPASNTTYYVTVTDAFGCSSIDSAILVINSAPIANAGTDTAICSGTSVIIGGKPTASGGTSPYTYLWSPGTGLNSTSSSNPTANPTVTTNYTVTVTDRLGCSATASITVTVHNNPVANAGPGVILVACSSDSAQLGGTPSATGGTPPYIYVWQSTAGLSCDSCPNPYVSHLGSNSIYTLFVTDSFGCSNSSQALVTVKNSTLTANAGNGATFCHGSVTTVQLGGNPTAVGGSLPYNYSWTPVSGGGLSCTNCPNPNALPSSTTTYQLVVSDANGCLATSSVTITVNPQPTVNAGGPDTICAGALLVIGGSPTASGGATPYVYSWSPSLYFISATTDSNPTVQPLVNISYCVTVTDSNNCSNSSCVAVKVNQNPVANAGTNVNTVNCESACVTLGGSPTATGGTGPYFYAWSPATVLNNTGLSNPQACALDSSTTYTVTVTDANRCTATSSISITIVPSTLAANAGPDKSICSGQNMVVSIGASPSASGGRLPYTYNWTPAAGILSATNSPNPDVSPVDTTTYTLTVQDSLGCKAVDSMVVFVTPSVHATVLTDTSVCNGFSTVIGGNPTGSGGTGLLSYSWSPGTGLSGINNANPTATPASTTTYCVTVSDSIGCSASACELVTVKPQVVACAGSAGGIAYTNCPGSFTTLGCTPTATGGSGNYSYVWGPDSVAGAQVLSSTTVPNPIVTNLSGTTIFTVTVTDNATGCTATAQVSVNVSQSTLTASAGSGKFFCGNSTTCITIGGIPTAVGGVPPYTYNWDPITGLTGATTANPCVAPSVTTTYDVTVTDRLGCNAIDSVLIFVSPAITVNAGNDTTICTGGSTLLGGSPDAIGGTGSYTYLWSPQGGLTNPGLAHPEAQNITANTTYTLTVTDSLGCTASGSISIDLRPLPVANAGPGGTVYPCSGDSLILGGSPTASGTVGPYSYSWTPPFNIALSCTTCSNPTVHLLGHTTQFCVTVTDTFGCQNMNCTTVIAQPNTLFVNAGGPIFPHTLCSNVGGSCVIIGGSPEVTGGVQPYTYQWFVDDTAFSAAPKPQVCPTATTTYTLIVTDSVTCQASDSVEVVVNTPPVVSIAGLNSQYCVNAGNVVMTGTPSGGAFSGPGVTGNIFQPSVVGAGNYCITYTYTNPGTGCTGDTSICIVVNPLPVVTIGGNVSASYCQSDPAVPLFGTPPGGVFSGAGMYGNVFYPDSANIGSGIVTYTYTDTLTGCSNSAQLTLNVKANPTLSLAASLDSACSGQPVTITPTYSVDVFNISWSKLGGGSLGAGLNPIVVNPTGTDYCVIGAAVNTPNGCVTRDTICIDVYQPPFITDPVIANTCENQPVTVNIFPNVIDPQHHADVYNILVPPLHGTLTATGTGIYTYTPAPYFHGQDSFKFAVCNSICSNTCDTGSGYINVCYVPYPPVIVDTTITIYENDSVHVCPVIYDYNGLPLVIGNAGCDSLIGQLIFTSDSCFEYIPSIGFVGTQTLCITVCDTAGLCDTGTVVIHVIPINKAPLAYPEHVYTCISTPIGVNVAAATVDPNGNPLSYSYGSITGPGTATWVTTSNGAQVFVAGKPGDYIIPYYVCNHSVIPPFSLCDSSLITVTVIACDSVSHDSIAANNDGVVTNVGVPININELANDYYPYPDSLTVTIVTGPDLGGSTAVIDSNGSITYVSPTPGIDTIEYQICDPAPLCATAIIVIYVDTTPANIIYPPVAVNDYDSTNYQTTVIVPVLSNDHSPSGDSIHVTAIISGPDNGTTVINPNGTVSYTPDSNVTTTHPDTFVYQVCEVQHPTECDTATVVVYIRPDSPPLAWPEHVYTCIATPIGVNVAAATSDPYGNTLTFTYGSITGPAGSTHSWVTTSSGAQVFVGSLAGNYTIPYTVCGHDPASDGIACASNVITVTVINCGTTSSDSIAANNDGVVTNVGDTVVINELANDYYPNDTDLTVTILTGPDLGGATAVLNSNGTITYTSPTPGRDTIEYQICDPAPLCATAYIIITVDTTPTNIHVPPVAVNDYDSTNYETTVIVPVLGNDYSPSGDSIHVTGIISGPNGGTAVVNSNGTISVTPGANSTPTHPDTLVYQICDVQIPTLCDTATVVVYIRPNDLPPTALPEKVFACLNTPIGVDVAAATSDPHGYPLTYSYSTVTGPGPAIWTTTGNGAQVFEASVAGNYTVTYTVCNHSTLDGSSLCASNIITVVVTNCDSTGNDSIAANNDGVVTTVNTLTNINELGNDYYPTPGSLTVTIISGPKLPGSSAIINSNGSITYSSPVVGQDTIEYQICDPAPLCATAYIIITVDSVPGVIIYPPVAVNDFDSTNYVTPVTVPVLNNDYNLGGDSFHLTAILCQPDEGTVTVNPNGTVTYTPGPGATACHPDTFCYQICDVAYPTLCDTAQVVIYIRPSVIAVNDTTYTSQYSSTVINVIANDHSPDCDSFSVSTVITTGTVGTAVINPNGTITYTPNPGRCGFIDTFQYVDTSAYGARDTATVYVTVICCPTKLTAVADSEAIQPGDSIAFNPAANDIDSGAILAYEILTGPTHGHAYYLNDSTLVYVPNAGFCGLDHMQYEGKGPCGVDTGNITINVICHTPPYAPKDTVSACKTMPININVLLKDTSETGYGPLTVTNVGNAAPSLLGSITSINGGIITYTPNGITGTATFLYTVCDSGTPQACTSATVVIDIVNCAQPSVDTIYDTTFINTPGTACIGKYVNSGGNPWLIDSLCNPQNGTDSIVGPGDTCIVYIPNPNYTGNDTFCIVVCDTFGCTTSEVIFTVIDTNIKAFPIYCDADTSYKNEPDTLQLLAIDSIPKASDTTVVITTAPLNGHTLVNTNLTVTYTPDTNYVGTDEFIYEVCAITGSYKYCDTASVCVTVVDTSHHCIIPDGFSPNGDGVNDVYVIPCNDNYPAATLKVFSRWGDEVWQSNGPYQNNWDGKNQEGVICPSGTYFIIYDYNDGIHKSVAKFVVINR